MINKEMFQFPIRYTSPIHRTAIGWGVHQTVADECKAANIKKALIVTTGLKGTGIIDEIRQILTANGVANETYDKVTSNPKDYQVMEAFDVYRNTGCDGVVSVGGGSSHDCAKGLRSVAANKGIYVCDMAAFIDPPWMEEVKKYKPVTIPQIAVNTTAGTGAECTFAAAITNTRVRAKQLLVMPGQTPTVALIDPLLVRLMPKHIAAWTGIDTLAHAFEGYVSKTRVPHTASLMLGVIKMVAENLREFTYNRMNHTACEQMCWAESMGGVGLHFGGGTGIVHGLGHTLSVLTDCHHGLANAVLTIPGERYNQPSCPEKFAEMAQAMGVDTRGLTKMQAADKWFEEMERLLTDLNITTGHLHEQFGLQQEDLEHFINTYANSFHHEGNPREFDRAEISQLLESIF
jgi:methanol:N,N-dimethyl-4-nitrosoaniline oxidoreductase